MGFQTVSILDSSYCEALGPRDQKHTYIKNRRNPNSVSKPFLESQVSSYCTVHWLLDVTFSEDESRFLSENAHTTMNALRKFALTVHKNYLAASGKKRSLKANMLVALIRPENLLDLFAFL